MRQRFRTGVVLAGLVAIAVAVVGCGGVEPDVGSEHLALSGPLSARPSPFSFGTIHVGTSATAHILLTNVGSQTIDIDTVTLPPGPCTPMLFVPCVRPGQSSTLDVTFAPTSRGTFDCSATIHYRYGGVNQHPLVVGGSGTAS